MNQSDVMNAARGKKIKTIDSLWTLAVAVSIFPLFGIPLLWRNPRFERPTKVKGTIALLILTVVVIWLSMAAFKKIGSDIQKIQQQFNEMNGG